MCTTVAACLGSQVPPWELAGKGSRRSGTHAVHGVLRPSKSRRAQLGNTRHLPFPSHSSSVICSKVNHSNSRLITRGLVNKKKPIKILVHRDLQRGARRAAAGARLGWFAKGPAPPAPARPALPRPSPATRPPSSASTACRQPGRSFPAALPPCREMEGHRGGAQGAVSQGRAACDACAACQPGRSFRPGPPPCVQCKGATGGGGGGGGGAGGGGGSAGVSAQRGGVTQRRRRMLTLARRPPLSVDAALHALHGTHAPLRVWPHVIHQTLVLLFGHAPASSLQGGGSGDRACWSPAAGKGSSCRRAAASAVVRQLQPSRPRANAPTHASLTPSFIPRNGM